MSSEVGLRDLPVAIIGAGPIGLAAAAHLHARGRSFVVLEAGATAGASVGEWGHVRLFTPWRYNIDREAQQLLEPNGWRLPDPEAYPTGRDFLEGYLLPLAAHPAIVPYLLPGREVVQITRSNLGKLEGNRDERPFVVDVVTTTGGRESIRASAVIDASGSWRNPNPIGSHGLPVPGERENGDRIIYGPPDVLGTQRARYAGKRVLVIGSGHSALNALKELIEFRAAEPATRVLWAMRRGLGDEQQAGCDDDGLTERALLRHDVAELAASGEIETHFSIRVELLEATEEGIVAHAEGRRLPPVDEIIVATGLRPDLSIERELRLDLHHTFESPHALAELIDPERNACGTVPPHGVTHLAHPEPDFFVVGMKSYGRAPTFLMLTGYEQVRSVVCAIERDDEAFEIQLDLPERGLCAACTAYLDRLDGEGACGCGDGEDAGDCCDDDVVEAQLAGAAR